MNHPDYYSLPSDVEEQMRDRYIEVWPPDAGEPEGSLHVWDPNTSFDKPATQENLAEIVQEAIEESDRLWGKP